MDEGGTESPTEPSASSSTCVSHQINLAASPAAQLINRAQSVNSATASGIAQQAVLLGNTSSPALTASQAQMYLRAQMVSTQPGPWLRWAGRTEADKSGPGRLERVGIREVGGRSTKGQAARGKGWNKQEGA